MSTDIIVFPHKEQELLRLTMISIINKKHNPDLIIQLMTRINKVEHKLENHPSNMMKQLLTFLIVLFAVMNYIFTSHLLGSMLTLTVLWAITRLCLLICSCNIPSKLIEKHKRMQLLIDTLNGN